tara:strand:+ start:1107 stop:2039 length:933 start_codon:yes stop_codon:yes gene_type:complete
LIKEFPVISYKLKDEDPVLFSNTLGESFKDIGFCSISDHPIDTNLINEIIHSFGSFFELSEETKLRYLLKGQGGARGYTPFKIETAKDSNLPDLKEFWHTGRELPSGHHYEKWMLPNIWIKELPELKDLTLELYSQFDQLGKSLLRSLALYLKLDEKYFDDVTNLGNSVMRTIHYPKVNINEDGERAGAHEDINLITLLIGGHQPGLEIKLKDGKWLPVESKRDTIVCNVGDMLQRLCNHQLVSTTHRVVATKDTCNESRYSIPFFVHPNPDWYIDTLNTCITKDNPNRYPEGILAEDYLRQRLEEIKLI